MDTPPLPHDATGCRLQAAGHRPSTGASESCPERQPKEAGRRVARRRRGVGLGGGVGGG